MLNIFNLFYCFIFKFLFAWTIAGAISVYGNHSKVSFTTNRLYNYCDQVTYQFAFSIITLTWALYGLGLFMRKYT